MAQVRRVGRNSQRILTCPVGNDGGGDEKETGGGREKQRERESERVVTNFVVVFEFVRVGRKTVVTRSW